MNLITQTAYSKNAIKTFRHYFNYSYFQFTRASSSTQFQVVTSGLTDETIGINHHLGLPTFSYLIRLYISQAASLYSELISSPYRVSLTEDLKLPKVYCIY